ncbi:oxidoreductase [Muricauda sp. 2012CJ35-5]|uniref:Oxidoreductase n=1 Tax=Flagellimonas spongiicola TaxID=2942208 RepID=A0ABT0PNK7_9FLAO|nr:oxidoreductase [Allomuricauda spongiicola]MCL6272972.1 oxidoreductase [Allomuricauda spongiicola]
MRYLSIILVLLLLIACSPIEQNKNITSVEWMIVFNDSTSIRAIEFIDTQTLAFAGSNGFFGTVDVQSQNVRSNIQVHDTLTPGFRAIACTKNDFFMLSAGNPALLYKTGNNGTMELVYKEEGEGVFYDSMQFWDDENGIAIGDSMHGCLSIILTRDGGKSWNKVACSELPSSESGEGAFAASNTNISIFGSNAWIATTAGNVYKSDDFGKTWSVVKTPITHELPTQGIYSMDFYDNKLGYAIGGDYTQPDSNSRNKIRTQDGGLTWQTVADGLEPNYKSCVQFVPNSNGDKLVAVGFTGVSVSNDGGEQWDKISDEGFYSIRFLNDSIAYASGRYKIAKLTFK